MRRRIDRAGQKKCDKCKRWYNLSDFETKAHNKDGHSSICVYCSDKKGQSSGSPTKIEKKYDDKSKQRAYESMVKINGEAVEAHKAGLSYGQWRGLQLMEKAKCQSIMQGK